MAEKYTQNHESHELESNHEVEKKHLPDIEKFNQESLEKTAEQPRIEDLKNTVEQEAKSSEETDLAEQPEAQKHEFGAYTALKSDTYGRTLKRVQQKLSAPERAMSKVMHNKTVEKVSDGVGKTAARPSGILGGGIVSLLGSFVLLYMTKKYGFEYNFLMFFIFLAAGFILGVVIELAIFSFRKVRH